MDPDAAAPLIAQLSTLATAKAEVAQVQTLAERCATVCRNLDSLDYAAKRAAIDALGVEVRIWREGASDETGNPLPR
jgi:hypothetical protein